MDSTLGSLAHCYARLRMVMNAAKSGVYSDAAVAEAIGNIRSQIVILNNTIELERYALQYMEE